MNTQARAATVRVTSRGPFDVGSRLWRDERGSLVVTVIAKATYTFAPGDAAPLDVPVPLQEEDGHWDDDPTRSVHAPSDFAPFKPRAEVIIVGSAYAPEGRPARSIAARIVVGSVDKTIEAWGPRRFRADGSVEEAPLQTRFSLRYEYAAGGPGTDNPAGIDLSRSALLGPVPVPQLVPHLHEITSLHEHIPRAGFGPIAAAWPVRAGLLGERERTWLGRSDAFALPKTLPRQYFLVAPEDQRLERPLEPNETIIAENLHGKHPRLRMTLSGLTPYAIVAGSRGEPTRLQGDQLCIDTDRGICTLTFRAQIPLPAGSDVQVIVVGGPMGGPVPLEEAQIVPLARPGPEDRRIDEDEHYTMPFTVPARRHDGLPFQGTNQAANPQPPRRPSNLDGVMPFREADATSGAPSSRGSYPPLSPSVPQPPPSRPEAMPQALPFTPVAPPTAIPPSRIAAVPAPSPLPVMPSPMPPPLPGVPSPPLPGMPSPPLPGMPSSLAPMPSSIAPMPSSIAPSPSPPPLPPKNAPTTFESAFSGAKPAARSLEAPEAPKADAAQAEVASAGPLVFVSAKAASDAAAREARRNDEPGAGARVMRSASTQVQRLAVVDVLDFDPKVLPRLRMQKRFAPIFAGPRPVQPAEASRSKLPQEEQDRADVARVLSCARSADAAEIRRALAESLEDQNNWHPPLLAVAGDLRPVFDELEGLRAAVSVAQTVAGGDKRLLAAIAVAQEAIAAPVPPRPDTVLALGRQIEAASSSLSLPPRYVASEVERILLEGRKYKRRTLLGATRIRADLTLARGGETMLVYLSDAVATSLPLLPSYPVVVLAEARLREDVAETQPEALVAMALGRVLHGRAEG
ncbi:DUF2169 domain-containing protein [Polyangium sp. y55x31]|uniref:DUF2169 family type VI secretion system accessory protein n=1 Tax=Polyangium sp. y55x31 TaxID=3042688 RepID=UPI00248310A2|nr:DUF2169 domain-containing protein [Polyangium sp. y55x31]MDI1475990.1 DUF2169 domain-containing protein [Polyangium sp. y55x31]